MFSLVTRKHLSLSGLILTKHPWLSLSLDKHSMVSVASSALCSQSLQQAPRWQQTGSTSSGWRGDKRRWLNSLDWQTNNILQHSLKFEVLRYVWLNTIQPLYCTCWLTTHYHGVLRHIYTSALVIPEIFLQWEVKVSAVKMTSSPNHKNLVKLNKLTKRTKQISSSPHIEQIIWQEKQVRVVTTNTEKQTTPTFSNVNCAAFQFKIFVLKLHQQWDLHYGTLLVIIN